MFLYLLLAGFILAVAIEGIWILMSGLFRLVLFLLRGLLRAVRLLSRAIASRCGKDPARF